MEKEKPILFSGEMVRAILDGNKTQTRRKIKLPLIDRNGSGCEIAGCEINSCLRQGLELCPYGKPGDKLWVKETFYCDHCEYQDALAGLPALSDDDKKLYLYYAADGDVHRQIAECEGIPKLKPSIFMPRWASRIDLEIVNVRAEKLNDISESDAIEEGCIIDADGFPKEQPDKSGIGMIGWDNPQEWYSWVWEKINGVDSWELNPWVWVIEFQKLTQLNQQTKPT